MSQWEVLLEHMYSTAELTDWSTENVGLEHKNNNNRFTAPWILSGITRVSRYEKKHSTTHTYPDHQSSFICFLHLLRSMVPWHPPCSIYVPENLFVKPPSKSSLVNLLWHYKMLDKISRGIKCKTNLASISNYLWMFQVACSPIFGISTLP